MKVAYLVNQYPKVSHTFIRREIAAVESQGITVFRHSVRRTTDGLVEPADEREAAITTVLLDGGAAGLARATAEQARRNPRAFARALATAMRLGWGSERGAPRHLAYLGEACVLVDALAREGVDHLHAHFGTNTAAVALLARELGGPPYSFTVHGPEEFDRAPLLSLRDKIRAAAFVVAVSSFGRSQLMRQCGAADWPKIHVVPCGIDDTFLESGKAPIPAAPRLVSVGRLTEQKGQLVLIEALARLHRAGRAFEMVLVGDGELRAEVERAITANDLGAKVTITGWAAEAEVRARILDARALVLPSFAEGLPVVLMEALALGRPVVTTYVAGIPELVEPGRNGWLVPAGSVEHLVTAIEEVLAAPVAQLTLYGEQGRARVRERHAMRGIGETLAGLFRASEKPAA